MALSISRNFLCAVVEWRQHKTKEKKNWTTPTQTHLITHSNSDTHIYINDVKVYIFMQRSILLIPRFSSNIFKFPFYFFASAHMLSGARVLRFIFISILFPSRSFYLDYFRWIPQRPNALMYLQIREFRARHFFSPLLQLNYVWALKFPIQFYDLVL